LKYEFEITLVVRGQTNEGGPSKFNSHSIDKVIGQSLTELLANFVLLLAQVHRRLLNDCALENRSWDDDIPF